MWIVLSCLAMSEQLASADIQKPQPPLPPPHSEASKEAAKVRVLKRLTVRLTGYYKVVRGQRKYNVSYEADRRLNGPGKKTKSGKVPAIGMIAADWRKFPQGTQLRIIGCDVLLEKDSAPVPISDLIFQVEDTGGAVKNLHIDVFTGPGDRGRELAEEINDLQPKKFVIEVVEICQAR